jgi:hypothetical protein
MPKFTVYVKEIHSVRIDVDAEDAEAARRKAYGLYRETPKAALARPLYYSAVPIDKWYVVPTEMVKHFARAV